MRYAKLTVMWLALFSAALPAVAMSTPDSVLVRGDATVADRTDAMRAAALPGAFADALRRLTPEEAPETRIDAAGLVVADEALLKRFEYAQVTRPTASGIPSIKLVLSAFFDAASARDVLVRAGLPVWPRGGVMPTFWLIEDNGGDRRLLDLEHEAGLAGFRERLVHRGVNASAATNDLSDWQMAETLTTETVDSTIVAAAVRTGAGPAVLAWARGSEDGVAIDWRVADGDEVSRFGSSAADLDAALVAGIPRLVGVLAESQAVRPDAVAEQARDFDRGAGEYVVWLENLHRAGVYAEAVSLLQAQKMVAGLTPEQAAGDRVRLRLTLNAPLTQLIALLAADGRLVLSATAPGDADLSLRWQN
jgi:hypothetical protein